MAIAEFLKTADLLPEAMLLVSGGGVVVAANRSVANRLGLVPPALVGKSLSDLAADPPEVIERYLRACARTREFVPGSIRLITGEGQTRLCHSEGAVFRPRSGADDALILIRLIQKANSISQFVALNQRIDDQAQEIKRRRKAEEELREQREWLRVTLASIGDAVIATDTLGSVSYMNKVAEGLTAWTQPEAIGQPLERIFRIINEDTRRQVESPVDRVLAEGITVGLANHTILIDRNGVERSIDDIAAPIREPGGDLKGAVLVFHDVGERRILERELQERAEKLAEADRRKNEFLAMLAHELRNPLAPTLNALRVLRSVDHDSSDLDWATEIMDRQITHLARLVDDLLDVSRITQGKINLKKERVDLVQIITQTVGAVRSYIESRGHQLELVLLQEQIPLEADPARLEQVVTNLLHNAAKYTDEGGRIWLEAGRRDDEVWLRVKDTGVGIAPELLPSIFDLFVQADGTLARSQGGLGIGLTLARTLVHLHGGRIDVHSEGLDRGSEFTIRLPVARHPTLERSPPLPTSAKPGDRRRRVLIVDDNVDSAQTLARLVKRLGNDVELAYDGPSAIDAADAFLPEVVLLDIGLPSMDGYQVAERLRQGQAFEETLIIAVSGYGRDEDRRRSRQAGFDHHFVKPVDFDALIELLRRTKSS